MRLFLSIQNVQKPNLNLNLNLNLHRKIIKMKIQNKTSILKSLRNLRKNAHLIDKTEKPSVEKETLDQNQPKSPASESKTPRREENVSKT